MSKAYWNRKIVIATLLMYNGNELPHSKLEALLCPEFMSKGTLKATITHNRFENEWTYEESKKGADKIVKLTNLYEDKRFRLIIYTLQMHKDNELRYSKLKAILCPEFMDKATLKEIITNCTFENDWAYEKSKKGAIKVVKLSHQYEDERI